MLRDFFTGKWLDSEDKKLKNFYKDFQNGVVSCPECKAGITLGGLPPLDLKNCPSCNSLFFVPSLLNNWIVIRPLGMGGMGGHVCLACSAQDPAVKASVKLVRESPRVNRAVVEALVHEGKVGHSFGKHPGLAQIYEYGYLDDGAFVIMEMIEGLTLLDHIGIHSRGMNPEACVYYALDIVGGLERIYDSGYLYRDLNPSNVIIRESGYATLVDYGLCMTHDEAWDNRDGKIMGTPLYVAPERCLRLGEDFRTDIYSLGMVLFYAITGKPYFPPTEVMKVIKGHLRSIRTTTSSKMPGHDPGLVEAIDLMIKRTAEERFQSYDEIREKLYPVLQRMMRIKTSDPKLLGRRREFSNTRS